jgi:hypothetical protein
MMMTARPRSRLGSSTNGPANERMGRDAGTPRIDVCDGDCCSELTDAYHVIVPSRLRTSVRIPNRVGC